MSNLLMNTTQRNSYITANSESVVKEPTPQRFQGVTLCTQTGKWRVDAYENGKQFNIGRYEVYRDAVIAKLEHDGIVPINQYNA